MELLSGIIIYFVFVVIGLAIVGGIKEKKR